MELTTIIWMFMIGAAAAMVVMYYNSRFLGGFVRALLEIDATSPESAITAEEIGIKISLPIKNALKPGTAFSKTVIKTEDNRYYVAPDKVGLAKLKYRGKDTTIFFVLLCLVTLALVALALSYIFPDIINSASAGLSEMFGNTEVL
jgi:hypothetical protein